MLNKKNLIKRYTAIYVLSKKEYEQQLKQLATLYTAIAQDAEMEYDRDIFEEAKKYNLIKQEAMKKLNTIKDAQLEIYLAGREYVANLDVSKYSLIADASNKKDDEDVIKRAERDLLKAEFLQQLNNSYNTLEQLDRSNLSKKEECYKNIVKAQEEYNNTMEDADKIFLPIKDLHTKNLKDKTIVAEQSYKLGVQLANSRLHIVQRLTQELIDEYKKPLSYHIRQLFNKKGEDEYWFN